MEITVNELVDNSKKYINEDDVYDTIDYIQNHKKLAYEAGNKMASIILRNIRGNTEIDTFVKQLISVAYNHDNDKLEQYNTLLLYIKKNNGEKLSEEDFKKYKSAHKESQTHHVEYHLKHNSDMTFLEYLEFICDIYSSNTLRNKKINSELLEEKEKGKMSTYHYEMAQRIFSLINIRYINEIAGKFDQKRSESMFIELVRNEVINNNHKQILRRQ